MFITVQTTDGPRGYPPETTLFLQAQAGCAQNLNRLMDCHSRLVVAVVRRQVLGDLPFAGALQAGRIGLWRAILQTINPIIAPENAISPYMYRPLASNTLA